MNSSSNNQQGSQGSPFNALTLLQTAAAGSNQAISGGPVQSTGQPQSLDHGGQQPALLPMHSSQPGQSGQPQQQDHGQQQQAGQQLGEAARNQLVSMALSGDLAKALQLAGMHQGESASGSGSGGTNHHQQLIGSQPMSSTSTEVGTASLPNFQNSCVPVPAGRQNSVVVPCRARGMTMEHNFQTAYFIIPENVKHGDGLICSFPACRNRGVKFLYCQYCKDPVARRNFRNRHNHAEERAAGNQQDNAPVNAVPAVGVSHQPDVQPPNGSARAAAVTSSSSQQASETSTSASSSTQVGTKRSLDQINASEYDENIQRKLAKIGPERQAVWAGLLSQRPKSDDGDHMSAWLMNVMAVSDTKKPLSDRPSQDDSSESNGTDQATGSTFSTSSNAEEDTSSSENGDKDRISGTSGTSESLSPTASDSSGSEDGDNSGRDDTNAQVEADGKV